MRVPSPHLGFFLTLLLILATPLSPVWAASPDEQAEAKARYQDAARRYDLKEYAEALEGFREAYRLSGDPVFLFNIAQCERKLGHNQDAIDFYKSYLRRRPDAPNREEVDRRVEELEKLIVEQKTTATPVEPSPPQTVTTPVPVPVAGPGTPPPPATPPQPEALDLTSQAPEPAATSTPIYKTWWFWTGAGAVVAGGIVTAVLLTTGKKTSNFCPDCNETAGIQP